MAFSLAGLLGALGGIIFLIIVCIIIICLVRIYCPYPEKEPKTEVITSKPVANGISHSGRDRTPRIVVSQYDPQHPPQQRNGPNPTRDRPSSIEVTPKEWPPGGKIVPTTEPILYDDDYPIHHSRAMLYTSRAVRTAVRHGYIRPASQGAAASQPTSVHHSRQGSRKSTRSEGRVRANHHVAVVDPLKQTSNNHVAVVDPLKQTSNNQTDAEVHVHGPSTFPRY